MAEMRHPSGAKVYLNPVVDCFDGRPADWGIGLRPSAAVADAALEKACGALLPGERPCVHSDRGVHYRTASWIARCESHGLRRSMSRKGMSCDNARAEGFFGPLKQEFYYARGWTGTTLGEFAGPLDAWMEWYRSGRISQRLGWMTPDERRAAMDYAVQDVRENVRSPV